MKKQLEIPAEWFEIAARMERERKFFCELTDMNFKISEGHPLIINDLPETFYNLTHKTIANYSFGISIRDEKIVSVVMGLQVARADISFNDFTEQTKIFIRQHLTKILLSLDRSTYQPQNFFHQQSQNT